MEDLDRMRAERDFNMNPPDAAPGQGDDGWGDIFGDSQSSSWDSNSFTGVDTDINSILNGQQGFSNADGAGYAGGYNQSNQNKPLGTRIGDKIDEAVVVGAKGAWEYIKLMVKTFMNNKERDWNILAERVCKISVVIMIISGVFGILNLTFIPSIGDGADLGMGASISLAAALLTIWRTRKHPKGVVDEVPDIESSGADELAEEEPGGFSWDDDDEEESSWSEDGEEGNNDWDGLFEESSGNDFGTVDDSFFASNDSFDVEDTVSSLPDIPSGQYTRQYLFETFSKILPSIEPSFMDMEDVPDTTDEFLIFEDYLKRSAEQTGVSDDKLEDLQLQEVRKNLFIIQLIATRPTGLKEKEIANGIADCYKHDNYGMVINGREGVFSRVNSQVGRLIIDIFLCNNVMVSLGDVYRKKSSFILDSGNIMPLIWGVNEMGNVFCYDGMKDGNGGIIISGEARSGKSWKGQSLIAQMSMFMSPKELEFYFYDVKGDASDYAYLSKVLPHCKGFCGESLKFNDSIERLLERERKRRTDLLAGKYTNVKDYNKDHPYDKIPTIYIVIDEMATAMSEMKDKDIDIRKKFDSLLIQIATKYPYLEIKLMLFPHRIVNDIINKTVSSMISTRSVMGNVPADELKTALDIKKDFPYSLVKTGDMAIKTKSLNNGNAVYSHSEVLSTSEQVNRKIFDYIGAVWKKLEPDCKTMAESQVVATSGKNTVGRDNSVYKDDYSYASNSSNIADENTMVNASDIDNLFGGGEVDESFWDETLKDDESPKENDDGFWDNYWNR